MLMSNSCTANFDDDDDDDDRMLMTV